MASRRFFAYDPSDYYYPNPYYYHQPAPARSAGGFFPFAGDDDQYYGYLHEPSAARSSGRGFFPVAGDVDPYYQPAPARTVGRGFFPATAGNVEPAAARASVRLTKAGAPRPVSIPVRFVASDPEIARPSVTKKRTPSAEDAAVRVQAAARGFLSRKAVRALRAVEREAEEVGKKVAREAEALRGDARARVGVGEELMRLLLRLDAVRGAREYRKRVAKRVLALQDAVDALEQRPAPVAEAEEAAEAGSSTVEMVVEKEAVAPVLPGSEESNGEIEENTAAEAIAEMEVDEDRAEAEDTEPAPDSVNLGEDKPAAEGEWEMVADEPVHQAPPPQEPAGEEVARRPAAADGSVDANKLMAMVAALCEQSAQQCAVIGALADRVDALERAVRRVEDTEGTRSSAERHPAVRSFVLNRTIDAVPSSNACHYACV
ncbi:hypothetical protein EJB05_27833, partial [Eragrostis curvula]